MLSTYQETIDWLFQQFPSYQNIGAKAYKPSLENIEKLCASFGNPQNNLRFIHIAGTNGKGSTSSMLASILTESNQKVGLFTSPHIQDYTERIRINGQVIEQEFVIRLSNEIRAKELDFEPSFFEITFLLALLYFKENKCSICVIETGLGGRLDATNIITPILSLITNISIEHTQFLGNTIEEIATEKGGIIKPSIPVIIGERQAFAEDIFEKIAHEKGSTIFFASDEMIEIPENFPLLGNYQVYNFNLVYHAIGELKKWYSIDKKAITNGLQNLAKNTGFYGRMQIVAHQPLTIFDVSHNTAGIASTLKTIHELNKGKLHIVYGTSSDKDIASILNLFPNEAKYYFTEFSNERSAKILHIENIATNFELTSTYFIAPKEALASARLNAHLNDTILVFGSFFLISDFFKR